MKKLMSVLVCLCLLLCCGCGASPAASAPEQAAQTSAPEAAAPAEEPAEIAETPAETPVEEPVEEPLEVPADYAPDFRFSTTDRDGNVWDETVFAQHKLTMINYWEPWCGPCVGEMPDLQALYESYADQGFLILGVYATPGMEEDVDAVLDSTGVNYPILHSCEAFADFESGYVPTTIFVDQEGHVLHRDLTAEEMQALSDVVQQLGEARTSAVYIGARSYSDWAALIEGLL